MANERLRRAIQQAGLGLDDIADHVGVDVKTAERWLTKGRLPHARNRAQAASLLSVDELELWPEAAERRKGRSDDRRHHHVSHARRAPYGPVNSAS
jgi:transcriptional regulator with XRE-family HTH domain